MARKAKKEELTRIITIELTEIKKENLDKEKPAEVVQKRIEEFFGEFLPQYDDVHVKVQDFPRGDV